jgi:hypothetical protein
MEVFEDGEELYYEVNYSFINIGWVKFNTERQTGKSNVYNCKAVMKSNDAMPFVYVNYEFYSTVEVRDGNVVPLKFTAYEFNRDNKKSTLTYNFNYDSGFVYINKIGYEGQTEVDKRINSSTLFMHIDSAMMKIDFNTAKTDVSIDNVDYDISSVYLEGYSYFTAVFGLTGDFSGWFSNDAARVPLKAKLKVKIGNVTLELKSWKRKSWKPPQF